MLRNLKIAHQALILVLLPVIFEVIFITLLASQMHRTYLVLQDVNESRRYGEAIENVVQHIYEMAHVIDKFKDGGVPTKDTIQDIQTRLHEIDDGTVFLIEAAPTAHLREKAEHVAHPINRVTRIIGRLVSNFQGDDFITVIAVLKNKKELKFADTRDRMFEGLNELLLAKKEQQQNYDMLVDQQAESLQKLMAIVLVGGVLHVMLALFLWLIFTRDTGDSFRILMDNTRRLALGQPLNPPIPGKGEVAHLDQVFQDMAQALETARRKERAIIENAIDVICSFDLEGRFRSMSPASEQLFGYHNMDLIGTRMEDLIFADDLRATKEAIEHIKSGEGGRGQFEIRVKRKDGTLLDVLWAMHWSDIEEMMFCVAHDITERKEMERMKQEFVAMVSHDLRTPLTSIQGFLTLLSTGMYGDLNDAGSQNLGIADANISRLIALINDLLDIEKMESGKLKMEMRDISIADVFDRSIGAVVGFADQQHVYLQADETDLFAYGDSDRLVQVLVNLISNAIKFSPKESAVRLQAVSQGEFVEVRVTDQGRGVPKEYREVIFERFQQVKNTDATKKGGSGLGLAICKAIVEGHEGTIGVDSEEGKGSTFWFRIPKRATVKLETANVEMLAK